MKNMLNNDKIEQRINKEKLIIENSESDFNIDNFIKYISHKKNTYEVLDKPEVGKKIWDVCR